MRPTRRHLLRLGLGGAALAGAGYCWWQHRRAGSDVAVRLDIGATPISAFDPANPSERRFGALTFRSGLDVRSSTSGFGGLSALWRDPGGSRLVSVTDRGQWFTAAIRYEGGALAGLDDARLSPVLGQDGAPLRGTGAHDCEALAIVDGVAFVGIERVHQVLRFDWAGAGTSARGRPIALPPEIAMQPANKGIEALAVAPSGHPLAGALLAFAEAAASGEEDPSPGWVLTGKNRFSFRVGRSGVFNVTDAAFLPSGELLLLERSFSPLAGVGCRIRRIPRDAIRPDAVLDGEVLLEVDRRYAIDNMEGIAITRDRTTGETVLTLISDDNFNPLQRTLLLEFALSA
ncbi:esterase-like activity of phytase family protein [Enterovirga rhinocerotis]|uniref:Phytase-like domain-containing protein n=1 Tax=Enterovirga rhinocerotis TaxID=1339210 RepID=A0A4R7C3L5_9HYPH|nr:esterase-like activity of phytase family protein [Enterovirga rhinocerotis]TDR93034.1 hypothetical protein EV668_0282 [Enterovirga rhinocerotis]